MGYKPGTSIRRVYNKQTDKVDLGTNVKIVSHKPAIHSGSGKNFDYDSVFSSLHGPDSYSDTETVDDVIILRDHMDNTFNQHSVNSVSSYDA